MRKLGLYIQIAILALLLGAGHSQAEKSDVGGFNAKVTYCANFSPNLGFENARECDYVTRDKITFEQDTHLIRWAKVTVDTNHDGQIAIYINPHFLTKIEFFESANEIWKKQLAGSELPFNSQNSLVGGYYFLSQTVHAGVHEFYLKISGSGLNHLDIVATPWPSTDYIPSSWQVGIGMQLSGLTLILLFACFSYAFTPTLIIGRFCLLMLCLILCTVSGSGMMAKHILASHPHLDGPLFISLLCMRVGLWTWVAQGFLLRHKTPKWYLHACHIIYIGASITAVMAFIEFSNLLQSLLLALFLLAPIIQLIATINTEEIEPQLKKVLAWGFLAASSLVILALVVNTYPLGENLLPIYISRLTDFINPLILLSLILFQTRQIRNELNKVNKLLTQSNLEKEFERQLLSERRILIDMLTHELKNPLASINMAVGTLKNSFSNDHSSELRRIENISKSVKNMDSVIERVSLMNALDQQRISLTKSTFHLNDLVLNVLEDLPEIHSTHLSLDENIQVTTDLQFLKIILLNLLDNARKYSAPSSTIHIQAQQINLGCLIKISNQVNEGYKLNQDLLFTRYYRHPQANSVSGSGLGLFLIRELIQALGGKIEFEQISSFVTFTVILHND